MAGESNHLPFQRNGLACCPWGHGLLEAQSREGPWSLKPFTLQMEKRSPQKDRANIQVNYRWFSAHEWVCVFQEGLALTQFTYDKTAFITRTNDNIIPKSVP